MPRKSRYGGNKKRRGRITKNKSIVYADSSIGQLYGTVDKALGNCHFNITTLNEETKVASLSGTLKKCGRVKKPDLVLIEPLTENEDGKYKIIFKYTPKQKSNLEKEGRLKVIKEEVKDEQENNGIVFEGDEKENQDQVLEINEDFVDFI